MRFTCMFRMSVMNRVSDDFCGTILQQLDATELNTECQRWALAHGFVQRRFLADQCYVIPYPFTLSPTPYPRDEYHRARRLQSSINALVQRLAFDIELMDTIFDTLIDCDPFIRRLRSIYNQVKQLPHRSRVETCIIRTDYMLQQRTKNNNNNERTKLRLIEINTIAVGLGAAAKLMHTWHKRVLMRTRPELVSELPDNESHDLIIDTLFESWKIYDNPQAIILFVVPEREFNIGDQSLIEEGLLSRNTSSLLVKFVTLTDVHRHCSLDSTGTLLFNQLEVALVYYRCAYDPNHFFSEDIWQAYLILESSRAIKCPSLRYHLAGMKCFQLAIANEAFLESIFPEQKSVIDDLRSITEEMFSIDQAMADPLLCQRILSEPESFYLKQCREGGGHVYCGSELKQRLDQIVADQQSNRYFLMSRIYAPTSISLVRSSDPDRPLCTKEMTGELGMFGGLISRNGQMISERLGGSLYRSKAAESVEGGIATGQGWIDSVVLV